MGSVTIGSWVLTLILIGPSGITSTSASFNTKAACEYAAAQNVKAANLYSNLGGFYTCNPGGVR